MRIHGLSKSKILSGLQCPRRLYLDVHRPDLARASASAEYAFAEGHRVGEVARTFYPEGTLIRHDEDLGRALEETRKWLEGGEATVFEATVQHDGVLIRADILVREAHGDRLVEVKSSTGLKEHYLSDCAIQAWVLNNAGLSLHRVELAHVDSGFVYGGDGDYRGLLKYADITRETAPLEKEVPKWVSRFRATLAGEEPEVEPGDRCEDPYPCPYRPHCQPGQPEYPVSILPRGGEIAAELLAEGYADLRDVPPGRLSNPNHERVRRVTRSGKAELSPAAGEALRSLPYPRYYLDFETVSFAVPIWAGTRPYQQLPFQWSCHIEDEQGQITHAEFLDTSGEAPMRPLAESLIRTLGDRGPVFSYSHFERTVIRGLAQAFPDLAEDLEALASRLVDLLPLIREHYYHPAMKGSWSIKAVLPTIAPDLNYADLGEVQDGMAAGAAYKELLIADISETRKEEIVGSLREYCKLDTEAMVRLARFLKG